MVEPATPAPQPGSVFWPARYVFTVGTLDVFAPRSVRMNWQVPEKLWVMRIHD
jgi:hypothetical protein